MKRGNEATVRAHDFTHLATHRVDAEHRGWYPGNTRGSRAKTPILYSYESCLHPVHLAVFSSLPGGGAARSMARAHRTCCSLGLSMSTTRSKKSCFQSTSKSGAACRTKGGVGLGTADEQQVGVVLLFLAVEVGRDYHPHQRADAQEIIAEGATSPGIDSLLLDQRADVGGGGMRYPSDAFAFDLRSNCTHCSFPPGPATSPSITKIFAIPGSHSIWEPGR